MLDTIVAQRHKLVERVAGLTQVEWETQSLCDKWKVRDVVGHLLSILEIPLPKFLFGIVKARSFDRYCDTVARQIGCAEPSELVTRLRSAVDTRYSPPVLGPMSPLCDLFIHTRDIERPLGRTSELDPAGLLTALEFACGGKAYGFVPSARTNGLRFEAPDLDWGVGDGPVVRGPGEAILMTLNNRASALADLSGDGAPVLALRLG